MSDTETIKRPATGTDVAILGPVTALITEIARGNIRHTRINY